MTAYIKFTALSGAHNEDPLCYLLEVDEAKILLDCGWTDKFDPEDLKALKRLAKQVDAVLLSHADIEHIGAYPYATGHLGLSCPAYGTFPIHDMGQICMYDAYQSKADVEDFTTFTLDDVDAAFEKMVTLRYSQPYSLSGKCKGITVTAYAAGHTVGGTIWKVKKNTDEVVYAVDYNHKKDRHLNGTVLMTTEALGRPSVLITDAYNATNTQPLRKTRDSALVETLTAAMAADANVLIPVDSSTRVLELSYLLEAHWAFQRLQFPLVFLAHQSYRTMTLAKTMLEWMGDGVAQAFTQRREAPFDFKFLRTLYRIEDLEKIRGPKIVLASVSSLDAGWSQHMFRDWASVEKNIVILPERGLPGSMTRKLYDAWNATADPVAVDGIRPAVNVELDILLNVKQKTPLEGDELEEHLAREQQKREQDAEAAAKQRALMEEDESDLDEDEGGEVAEVANILATGYDIYVKDQLRTGGFFKQSQSYRMFPVHELRKRVDDYGEQIDPAVYMRGEYEYATEEEGAEKEAQPMEVDKMRPKEDAVPSKYASHDEELKVRCKVIYIDFEGRSDGRSIKNILPQVAPRKLMSSEQILIRGSDEATQDLARYCLSSETLTNDVYTPEIGECINVSAATNIFQVKLTDSLVSSLKIAQLGDYELAYVSGVIRFPEDETLETATPATLTITDAAEDDPMQIDTVAPPSSSHQQHRPTTIQQIPILDVVPSFSQTQHRPVLVGDVKLSEFRRILQGEGFSTEFVSGVLIVNTPTGARADAVIVRRAAAGRLAMEGCIGDVYYRVRRLLYGQHAIL
ncbi:cleavage and polyadenylation specificity factor subunit 2 [Thoreauomyces humboldtii]|nr:cleavage and polyadenylation specificity factor subunit 2 [Thoreauomyces humboldtii]